MRKLRTVKWAALALVLVLVLSEMKFVPSLAATSLNDKSICIKQRKNCCTMDAMGIVFRRKAIIDKNENWKVITEDSMITNRNWNPGLVSKPHFEDDKKGLCMKGKKESLYNMRNHVVKENGKYVCKTNTEKDTKEVIETLKRRLDEHPEGIVLYVFENFPIINEKNELEIKTKWQHAVALTGYKNGSFYCSDPGYGKVNLNLLDSNINKGDGETVNKIKYKKPNVKSLEKLLKYSVQIWYVDKSSNKKTDGSSDGEIIKNTKPTINVTSYPTSIKKGSSYGLRGTISSANNVTSIKGYAINSSGTTVLSTYDNPNKKSNDIRYLNLNDDMVFNKLQAGQYTLKIVATDASGGSSTWSKSFTVTSTDSKPKPGTTTVSVSDSTVTPNDDIKIGWTNAANAESYLVQVKNSSGSYVFNNRYTANSCTIGKLPLGSYTVYVTPCNSAGNGSAASASVKVGAAPGAFSIISDTEYEEGEDVTVRWTASSNAKSYVASIKGSSSPYVAIDRTIPGTECNFDKQPAGDYSITVVASNDFGRSTATGKLTVVAAEPYLGSEDDGSLGGDEPWDDGGDPGTGSDDGTDIIGGNPETGSDEPWDDGGDPGTGSDDGTGSIGSEPETGSDSGSGNETPAITKPTINVTSYPTTITKGSSFGLRGTISSANNVTSIKGYTINSSGTTMLSTTDYPNAKSSNIQYLNLNDDMLFYKLSEGSYTLKIVATDSTGGSSTWSRTFTVKSAVTKPTISVTSYPTTITKGSSFGLRGTISSANNVTSIKGYTINSSGTTVLSTTDYPNAKSSNIQYLNLNDDMLFYKLSEGSYTLKIVATDSTGGSSTWSKTFTVKSGTTKPTINVTSYPTSIKKGSSYGLRGTISSANNVTSIKGYTINSSGTTVLSTTDYPNAKSSDIRYLNLNDDMVFNRLSAGSYTLKIVATDSTGGSSTWSKTFTVK